MRNELTIVTVSYSFDTEVVALIFNSYEEACDYIKADFEEEKRIDIEESGYEIDEEMTYCEESMAVLATCYRNGTETTTWTVARVIDKRN